MDLSIVDSEIKKIIADYETRDPFKIAKRLGITVIEEDLGEIYGYYNRACRIKMIHINGKLDEVSKRSTAAHELGHAVLHPNENTPMLSSVTIVSEMKIEREANHFAANLIIDKEQYFEDHAYEDICIYRLLSQYGLPKHFDRYIWSLYENPISI